MIDTEYRALDANSRGRVTSWPRPMNCSRLRTMEAITMDKADSIVAPSRTATNDPTTPNTDQSSGIRSTATTASTTATWMTARMAALTALPRITALRNAGATSTRWVMPRSRSQMMAMPEKMATNSTDWDSTPGTRKALYGTSWVPSSRTRDTAE